MPPDDPASLATEAGAEVELPDDADVDDAGEGERRRRIPLPPTAVVLAWLVGRLCVVLGALWATAAAPAPSASGFGFHVFALMDGNWYRNIAEHGFSVTNEAGQSGYPFFPGLPGILGAGKAAGVPPHWVGVVLANVALLVALWGVYVAASRIGGRRVGSVAVWTLGLFPFTTAFSMVYPDVYVLAASVWAFVAVQTRGRDIAARVSWCDVGAAALCAAAALMRPNGILVAVGVAAGIVMGGAGGSGGVAELASGPPGLSNGAGGSGGVAELASGPPGLSSGAGRRAVVVLVPALAVVAVWIGFLWMWTGDPLLFVTAKGAWAEQSLYTLIAAGGSPQARIDAVIALAAFALLVWQRRRLPVGWLVFSALYLVPPFLVGLVGFGRYVATCFPVFVALGLGSERVPRPARWALAGASAAALVWMAFLTLHVPDNLWVP